MMGTIPQSSRAAASLIFINEQNKMCNLSDSCFTAELPLSTVFDGKLYLSELSEKLNFPSHNYLKVENYITDLNAA